MNKEQILKSDVLDIVFEKRNKAYGAYDLRKFYGNRLVKSLGLMIAGVVVLSAFTFLPKKEKAVREELMPTTLVSIASEKKEEVKKKEEPKKQEQPKTAAQKAPTQIFTKPVVVAPNVPIAPLEGLNDSALIASTTTKGKPGELPVVKPYEPPAEPGDDPQVPVVPEVDTKTPTDAPEIMPSYPGGMEALAKFLQRNLVNPKEMEEGEMVSVKVRFVVNYDGKLQRFETVQDGGEAFNKEVIRVLKKMPEWIPGRTRGQNVSVYYTIPVKFVPAE